MISSNVFREREIHSPAGAPKPSAAHRIDAPHPTTLVLVITTDKHHIEINICQDEEGDGC